MSIHYTIYEGYSAGQLALDPLFRQWVIFSQPEDYQFWNTYLQQYPEQQDIVLAARVLVLEEFDQNPQASLTIAEKSAIRSQIFSQLETELSEEKPNRKILRRVIQAAAVFAGLIFMVAALYREVPKNIYAIVEKTSAGETRWITLEDSSVVILNANSTLSYSSDLKDAAIRKVTLEGNAFFRIRKKTDHQPFEVYANKLSVAVLGTEFNVNARQDETEVVLTSGKVKLSDQQTNQPSVLMNPGEIVQYNSSTKTFTINAIDAHLYESWANGNWHFSSTSLQDITRLIYAYYGVETVFADDKAKNLKINAVIPVSDLKSFIRIISKTLDINIYEKDNQLIIHQ